MTGDKTQSTYEDVQSIEGAEPLFAGHPSKKDGEGPNGAADSDRGSL